MIQEGKNWMTDLNMVKYGKKLWRILKQLHDERSKYSNITLRQDDTLIHWKKEANLFADTSNKHEIYK